MRLEAEQIAEAHAEQTQPADLEQFPPTDQRVFLTAAANSVVHGSPIYVFRVTLSPSANSLHTSPKRQRGPSLTLRASVTDHAQSLSLRQLHLSLNQSLGTSNDQTSLLSGCACPPATQILSLKT